MKSRKETAEIGIGNQQWVLHPDKAVYWAEEHALIVSDIHLGKSGHFRKSGIAAPAASNLKNLQRLNDLIVRFSPAHLIVLGDFFHSGVNREWFLFEEWREQQPDIDITLVTGNHDILHPTLYSKVNITTVRALSDGPFYFVHDAADIQNQPNNQITVSGHIHPGVMMKYRGRQKFTLPCFYFTEKNILLPAFGEFTGLYIIQPENEASVFTIADNKVFDSTSLFE